MEQSAIRLTVSGELFKHVTISAWRAGVGFSIGGSIGLFFGVLNGVSRPAELLADSSIS